VTTIEVKNTTNQSARPNGVRPRLIVLHADGAKSAASSINWIMNPVSDVSYHAIIERNGSITQLVPDEAKAWHAGVSMYAGVPGVNDYSIGICLSNRNDGLEPYTPQAVQQAVELVAAKMRRWAIGLDAITTHEAIARPMGRKSDPGVQFPLAQFITAVRHRLARP
jgi:N-acetylmuramoyl-L-alanine amidase